MKKNHLQMLRLPASQHSDGTVKALDFWRRNEQNRIPRKVERESDKVFGA